jgi:lipoate---protein ligase
LSPALGETRYLEFTEPTIEANLALDEALLMESEERGLGPLLRVWEPRGLAVVLGASCRLLEDVHVDRCDQDGVSIARRSSGGGTVIVGPGTLNATVILACDSAAGLSAVDTSQAFVLERIATALRDAGAPVQVKGLGDLTLGNLKVSGSAQRRLRRCFLVHLTVLYGFPTEIVSRYLKVPKRQPEYRAGRTHDAFLTNLDLARGTLIDAIRTAWSPLVKTTEVPRERVDELVASRFGDRAWVSRL